MKHIREFQILALCIYDSHREEPFAIAFVQLCNCAIAKLK